MGYYYDLLMKDVRFKEGMNACINCGTCTAICPAASFYNYDPRTIANTVQTRDDEKILELLKSETIWYCGECMSCTTRCPRSNKPGLLIIALRNLSQELGLFVESEKGRQQLAIKRTVGEWALNYGYCVVAEYVDTEMFPEQGPIWDWEKQNLPQIMEKLGANYKKPGPGALRNIPKESLEELKQIFEVTGAITRFEKIEKYSKLKAEEMKLEFGEGFNNEYFQHIYNTNQKNHYK
ncbi:MAG TPA: 4Fe-4S dicluster domain-containing protein [Bacteroidales bacterium]|nr:4Fe-4S dicluster domain-containing protein [Bacteroidales bacterium]